MISPNQPLRVGELAPLGAWLTIHDGEIWLAEEGEQRMGQAGEDLHAGVSAAHDGSGEFFQFAVLTETLCPTCTRHILATNAPATGWIAPCGRRLTRLNELGPAINCVAAP